MGREGGGRDNDRDAYRNQWNGELNIVDKGVLINCLELRIRNSILRYQVSQ